MALTRSSPHETRPLVDLQDLRAGALTSIVLALLGVPLGLLWAALAPRAAVASTDAGALVLDDIEDKAFIAADLTLFLLGLGLGLLGGVVAFWLARGRGPGVVVGLVLGSYLAVLVAASTGVLADARQGTFDAQDRPASAGVQLAIPNTLLPDTARSHVIYLGGPAAAALMFGVLGGLAARREADGRLHEEPGPGAVCSVR